MYNYSECNGGYREYWWCFTGMYALNKMQQIHNTILFDNSLYFIE